MAVPPFDYQASLLACAQGDQAAFQQLYEQEAPHMLALCAAMLSQPSAAEEIVRDAFVLIWKNASSYDPKIGSARAWMYSIARYRALNRLRQSGPAISADARSTDSLPDTALHDNAPQNGLGKQLAELDETQRRPILMAFYNGSTYEQIATRLGMPADVVRANVQAGLHTLGRGQHA